MYNGYLGEFPKQLAPLRKIALVLCALLMVALVVAIPISELRNHVRKPTPVWRVNQIRPDGTVQKSWTIQSHVKPELKVSFGGVLYIARPTNEGIVAPAGWMLEVEKES